ncbi:MAG: efflux transporter outer membrane subunit [Cellvibrionaceae bacterium]
MAIKLIFVPIIAATLLSCGTASTKQTEQALKEKLAGQTTFTAVEWSNQAKSDDITVNWLDAFNDSVLTALVSEAQANNRNLLAASAGVENAQALAKQAGAALLPNAGLSTDGSRTGSRGDGVAPIDSRGIGLQVSWEVDLWGRIRSSEQAAANSARAAQADFRYAQHSLASATAKAYFALIDANNQIAVAKERLGILEETLRIVTVQYNNGLVSAQDLALTRSDIASAREQLITLEGAQRNAARALEVLLGRYPSAELQVRAALPTTPPPPPAGIPSELLERRPDLVAAERRVAAAFNKRDAAKAARLPSLSLTGNVGGTSSSLATVLDPANTTWRLGANLLASIFDGGSKQAQVDAATAEQKQSLFNYGQLALNAFNEVETALDQGVVLDQRKTELVIVEKEAQEAYRIASLRYKEGETNLLDVLTIQQRLIAAKSNLTTIKRLILDQRTELYLALGGHW